MSAPAVSANATQALQGVNPYFVGGGILLLLIVFLVVLLAFGAGRDHT